MTYEIQTLRNELDLKPKEILISPVANKYTLYHKVLVLSGFYEYYDTHLDSSMFFVPNHAFIFFCSDGHLDWAKELFHLGDVSLEHCHESSFRHACDNWYLEVAKWLYSLRCIRTDILVIQIKICVYDKQWDIAKWLWFLVSKNRQIYILSSLRYHKRRDLAEWLKSLNK